MATQKQEKLINLIVENLGTPNNTRSMGELMLEAGYSEAQSKNPHQIIYSETIQSGIEPFVDKMESERQRIIKALAKKDLNKERFKDLVDGLDKFTKNIQLLSGGATDNTKVFIVPNEIAKKNAITPDTEASS